MESRITSIRYKNPLIRRAREFADRTDADIHLVHVSDDTFKLSKDAWQFAEMNLLRQTVFSDKSGWLENMSKHLSQVSPKVTWQN
ncbi:MAG: hypothetical protein ACI8Z1_000499 [Candidatus Azotimanducaceae bacterium]|jgi:hypothetical protein